MTILTIIYNQKDTANSIYFEERKEKGKLSERETNERTERSSHIKEENELNYVPKLAT